MLEKMVATIIVCALSSTMSFASPLFLFSKHKKESKNLHHQVDNVKSAQYDGNAYTNFSGQWQGRCDETPMTLTINQQGSWLFIKYDIDGEILDEEFQIGGVNTTSTSSGDYHRFEHIYAYFGLNNKKLVIDDVDIEQNTSVFSFLLSYTGVHQTTLELQNNQLMIQVTSHSFEDGEAFGPEKHSCVFSK